MTKNDVLYSKTHEWLKLEGKTAKVGISSYAAMHLGDIVFFDLPNVGKSYKKDDVFAAVESVKSASDLYLPVGGKIIAVNDALSSQPELVNLDPFTNWIVEIELSDLSEVDTLLDLTSYENTL